MNRLKLLILFCLLSFGVLSANAQSGSAYLKVFVHAGKIGNSSTSLEKVKVILRPLDVWSGNKKFIEAESENTGYYSTGVSFGEYELTVSAKGFQTYRANIYLPSSVSYTMGVRLHENNENFSKEKVKNSGKNKSVKNKH